MNKVFVLQELKNFYTSPMIRTLIQALSIGTPEFGVFDVALCSYLSEKQEKQFRIVFDTLNDGSHELSESEIYNNDYLYAFYSTVNYAMKSRTDEKARKFAEILKGLYAKEIQIEQFEDYIHTVDQLTDREFTTLAIKHKYEQRYLGNDSEDFEILKGHWDEYISEVCCVLITNKIEVLLILESASRKGCYNIANIWEGNPERFGDTNLLFQRICDALKHNIE